MAFYEVTIKEERTYVIEVEADNEQDAENKAFNDYKFVQDLCDETDAHVERIGLIIK